MLPDSPVPFRSKSILTKSATSIYVSDSIKELTFFKNWTFKYIHVHLNLSPSLKTVKNFNVVSIFNRVNFLTCQGQHSLEKSLSISLKNDTWYKFHDFSSQILTLKNRVYIERWKMTPGQYSSLHWQNNKSVIL